MSENATPETLVLGTRGSILARTQSQQVADAIAAATGATVTLRLISTRGDRDRSKPLAQLGGKGLFTAELEAGLLDGSIDLAVHSLKDLPTDDAEGLVLGCFPVRQDPRDAWVGPAIEDLPAGAIVGTGSLRRAAQVRAMRSDLEIRDIRGNVETRLAKRDAGEYDAIVLAMAGLARLGIQRDDVTPLTVDQMVPAVGQGALGVQCRDGDSRVLGLLGAIEHPETRVCAEAERAFLATLGGGCNVPAGCHVRMVDGGLHGVAMHTDADDQVQRVQALSDDGPGLGRHLAQSLLE
jgi:hydroxymethylbilane synthase